MSNYLGAYGIVSAPVPKKLLQMAGIDDCYAAPGDQLVLLKFCKGHLWCYPRPVEGDCVLELRSDLEKAASGASGACGHRKSRNFEDLFSQIFRSFD